MAKLLENKIDLLQPKKLEMANKTLGLIQMILRKYGKEDEIDIVLAEAKQRDLVRQNLNVSKRATKPKKNKSDTPKRDPTPYNLYCFVVGFGNSEGWATSELNKNSTENNFSQEAVDKTIAEFKAAKSEKEANSPAKKPKGASPYNIYVSLNSGDGKSFPELSGEWKNSELNKTSDNFSQEALDAAMEQYKAKKETVGSDSD